MEEDNILNICVIGRQVEQLKWSTIYDIFDDNKDNLNYSKYDVSNPKWETNYKNSNIEYDGFVYLATTPKYTNKPYVQLKASSSDDDILNAITELFNNFENKDENDDNINKTVEHIDDNSGSIDISSNCTRDVSIDDNNSNASNFTESNCTTNLLDTNRVLNSLVGIVIEINGKEVVLHKDDAFKLRELMEFTKEYGYNITDVIVEAT